MKNIYLPGYSAANKEEEITNSNFLSSNGLQMINYEWKHWDGSEDIWGIDFYIDDLIKLIGEEDYGIIGKSIGTFVAVNLLANVTKPPKYVILMGIPAADFPQEKLDLYKVLENKDYPIHIIHNRNDVHGNWNEVQSLLKNVKYTSKIFESNTHDYTYPEAIYEFLKSSELSA